MRAVGIDLGTRRVGIAVSDPGGVLASPHAVLERSASRAEDHRRIAEVVAEVGAGVVVVGWPLSLDGSVGPAARLVEDEVEALTAALHAAGLAVTVELHDERFSTVSAHRAMQARGVRERKRRPVVDRVAAAVVLQSWLDAHA